MQRYCGVRLAYSLAGGFLGGVYPLFPRSRGLNQFEINSEQIGADDRATTLSFRGTMGPAGSTGLLLGGYVADIRGIPFAWKAAGTLSLLSVPCYLALRRRAGLTSPGRILECA